ncbi:MAG: hypothetical protein KKE17_08330 [Proteobacteria bacterium]|nr:hypothetical protein [Pseudomonadota bacterium]MBU1709994.1 hypothetical protein [Pseudomonadota bacterium]
MKSTCNNYRLAKMKSLLTRVFVLSLCFTMISCGGGDQDPPAQTSENTTSGSAEYSASIGPAGGSLEVTDPASDLYGAKIIVPQGALTTTQEITISSASNVGSLPNALIYTGSSAKFGPADLVFEKPVTLVLPYADIDSDGYVDGTGYSELTVGAMYADPTKETWEVFTVISRDTETNRVTIQTNHFSTYLTYVGETTPPDTGGTDPTATTFLPGEHFTANPVFTYSKDGSQTMIRQEPPYYYLSVLRWEDEMTSNLDSHLTRTKNGLPCTINADFFSCTFDAATIFPKIQQSGNAGLWNWNCEYVIEHTILKNYEVRDDASLDLDTAGRIYCDINATDETTVTINWGFDVNEEIYYFTSNTGLGHMLAIRIWANYQE